MRPMEVIIRRTNKTFHRRRTRSSATCPAAVKEKQRDMLLNLKFDESDRSVSGVMNYFKYNFEAIFFDIAPFRIKWSLAETRTMKRMVLI